MQKYRPLFVKSLRLASYLGVVAIGLSVIGVRAVHAKAASAALALGEPFGRLDVGSDGSTLTINGQRLHLSAVHVDAGVIEVLDRLQRGCETHADGLADDLASMSPDFAKSAPNPRGFPGIALLRDERERRGVVACFATGESTGAAGIARRLARFSETKDLADIGGLRYVAVHAEEGGGSKIVATWSDDPLPLDALFPESNDAAGTDPGFAPRPANGRRLLSVRVEPAPYGVFLYASSETPERALSDYDAALVARGFKGIATTEPRARAYQSGLVDVLVTATTGADGTTLSIIESHNTVARSTASSTGEER